MCFTHDLSHLGLEADIDVSPECYIEVNDVDVLDQRELARSATDGFLGTDIEGCRYSRGLRMSRVELIGRVEAYLNDLLWDERRDIIESYERRQPMAA